MFFLLDKAARKLYGDKAVDDANKKPRKKPPAKKRKK
jgi:hypothetical protein